MDDIDKAISHLNSNQGRGAPRNQLEHALLDERLRRDRKLVMAILATASLLLAAAFLLM